ncbi:UNVERIFIED_CONTAM: Small nuclear ribonucleoprotein Sm D3 [Gekko kuhli]
MPFSEAVTCGSESPTEVSVEAGIWFDIEVRLIVGAKAKPTVNVEETACFGETLTCMTTAAMSIGVPIKVLHEAEGHIVTCETNTGEIYRGKLIEAEDNMNCQMSNITVTYRDGHVAQLEQVYIRGSKIRFLILPDMLKNAPMLKSMKNKNQGSGAGRGKAAILKAQVAARGRGRGMGRGNIFQKRR